MNDPYVIGFKPTSLKQLKNLDRAVAERIIDKILRMARNISIVQHEAMTGQWKGCYRFRMGDYRVIYSLIHDERVLIIEALGHRREVYDD